MLAGTLGHQVQPLHLTDGETEAAEQTGNPAPAQAGSRMRQSIDMTSIIESSAMTPQPQSWSPGRSVTSQSPVLPSLPEVDKPNHVLKTARE